MTLSSVGVENGVRNGNELRSFAQTSTVLDVPNLIQVQLDSFEWFKTDGLKELFEEISPIEDFPGGRFQLTFEGHQFEEPKQSEEECRERETTFSAPLYVTVGLHTKGSGPGEGEIKYQKLFIGDIPMMTTTGTFIINGAERVVVSQLVRSPGVYFTTTTDPTTGRLLASAKLIPIHGAWMEFDTDKRDVISVKVDRKRKTPVTMLLRAIGFTTDEEIHKLFEEVDIDPDHPYIQTTIEKDTAVGSEDEALLEFYRRLRPGEPPSVENAKTLLENLFYNPRRYDLGRVGRYKLNRKLGPPGDQDESARTLSRQDIIHLLQAMILVNRGEREADDIDHLGNRRVRAVGELIQNHIRVGLMRMERVIKERMTTQVDPATTTPAALINIRPVVASVREFFGGSQLSQFMDQTNPLAELTHKRRLSALGPGGLSRDRAGFDVRDVHPSHYGRICPIETPEGPNIGLLGSLATYARTNNHGFIETPYRRVHRDILSTDPDLVGRTVDETIVGTDGRTILNAGGLVSKGLRTRISKIPEQRIAVRPYVAGEIVYLTADEEEEVVIAQANSRLNEKGEFVDDDGGIGDVRVESRIGDEVAMEPADGVQYMDVSPMQLVSVSTALIPFLEHDDASRALLGSNMQRQAVPLLQPEAPLVGTGMEKRVAVDSGQVLLSRSAGVVTEVTGSRIVITDDDGEEHEYKLKKFVRSNQGTCINQHPIVDRYDRVGTGDILADSSSTSQGELALGHNVLVAFMSWEGYNFEDAIILSERMVREDKFTSIHIEKHEVEARDTKLGPEEITRDIPNVGEDSLRNLDEEGIIRIGAEIGPGDILVGKITPKGETELSAEEKLLRAIFGEKARDVKDTSLRVPHGERGKVIEVRVLSKDKGDELPPGVSMLVRLWIAQTRKVTEGDKMANRHGNKGVIAKILPEEDMPYLADGTPVDVILNPIGVPSRMNLGQVLETHLGMAAHELGYRAVTPVFDGAVDDAIENGLAQSWLIERSGAVDPRPLNGDGPSRVDLAKTRDWLSERGYEFDEVIVENGHGKAREACLKIWFEEEMGMDMTDHSVEEMKRAALELDREHQVSVPILGKSKLYDGRTGEEFDQPIAVGYIYMLKLIHLVEDKIHARSTGPYSLITQQPLGGKAQFGGQRFGEMEVWALEAYSAAYNLQEMLTVKSDDVVGRVKTYEAIVKGDDIIQPGIPESFHVLVKELQSLGLSVELIYEQPDMDIDIAEEPSLDDLMDGVASLTDSAAIPGFDDLGPMPSEMPTFDDEPAAETAEQPVSEAAEAAVEEPSEATGGDG
ncbi:MAG: DNA-directed RNA polymerase subunit beta [Dehalococcoidia bacterium]|nr:DNA-directed RNA polymerase subunit beta [Dehalococcoidia bacterium]